MSGYCKIHVGYTMNCLLCNLIPKNFLNFVEKEAMAVFTDSKDITSEREKELAFFCLRLLFIVRHPKEFETSWNMNH